MMIREAKGGERRKRKKRVTGNGTVGDVDCGDDPAHGFCASGFTIQAQTNLEMEQAHFSHLFLYQ
jgi:hypothetical protein